jgi:hypothetical protein
MYFHSFLFRWHPQATAEHRDRAGREILAFSDAVPGLLEVVAGPNLASNSGGFEFGGTMRFTDAAAYRAYVDHPLHAALLEWLVPLIDAVELDLETEH